MKRIRRLRFLPALAVAMLALGLGACTRSIGEDLSQKGQVLQRDFNHAYDTFSKYFFNHDPDDPYLD
ncbi:MAG: hypothetical protein EYC70_04825 [Planctomycetota bacterium]|nr:MAG: hypothetical protein EYC70_04825 [Planctomycetota bacterium]